MKKLIYILGVLWIVACSLVIVHADQTSGEHGTESGVTRLEVVIGFWGDP